MYDTERQQVNEVGSSHDQVVHLPVSPIEQELRNPPAVRCDPSPF